MKTRKHLKSSILFLLVVGCFCLSVSGAEHDFSERDFSRLESLKGSWKMEKANYSIVERWEKLSPSAMAGLSYKVAGGDTTFLEEMRLFLDKGKITYAALAYGQNKNEEIPFNLKSIRGKSFVFENLSHDYPQRIVYEFVGADSIHANIEGSINGRSQRADYYFSRIK